MEMVFKIRMIGDEDDNFLRDYEVLYSMTLFDFHNFICDDLGYDAGNMTSFFLSNKRWEKLREFTLIDMGENPDDENAPIAMENVTLGQIFHNNNDRLIYTFDIFEDRALFLELMATEKCKDVTDYPIVRLANGEAPDQFDASLSPSNKSIFDEAMDDYSDFDGDDQYDDEY